MKLRAALSVLLFLSTASACAQPDSGTGLVAFRNEAQLQAFLKGLKQEQLIAQEAKRKAMEASRKAWEEKYSKINALAGTKAVQETIGGTAAPQNLDMIAVTGSAVALLAPEAVESNGITNVQTEGVDEGGIIKKVGDILVILRRGRLFTVRATQDELRAVSVVDAYGPGILGEDAWYDEMLISGRTVVVIGYNYVRGGTEVGLFDLEPSARLTYRASYHLRSDDYYSSRNFASRLIGQTLIFYTPLTVDLDKPSDSYLPAYRRWQASDPSAKFTRIAPAQRIYRSGLGTWDDLSLHTVTRCDLSGPQMECESTAVLGPGSGSFYVSSEAVYVWTEEWPDDSDVAARASVLRLPLDGSRPSALRVQGSPIDQMSFLERDGYLNVLVGADAGGQRMWRAEGKSGSLALLRVPLTAFGDSRAASHRSDYLALPSAGEGRSTQNRFAGDWLLYGNGYSKDQKPGDSFAMRYARRILPSRLSPGHNTERIEALGKDALLVGNQGKDLVYSSVRLDTGAQIADQFRQKDSQQSESRTHGFFYRSLGPGQGLLGLPVEGDKPPSLSMQFLRNEQLDLREIGNLQARATFGADDACKASCVDWYGGSRPIFIGDRIYALMGYELVEGELIGGRVRETRRLDFKPPGESRQH